MAERLFRSLNEVCVAAGKRSRTVQESRSVHYWTQPCRRSSIAKSIGLRERLQLITRETLRDSVAHQFSRRVKIQLLHEAGLVKFDGFHGHMEQ